MTFLAPIQRHLDALAAEGGFPGEAVDACIAQSEQAAPALRAILQRAARGTRLNDAEAAQLFIGLHILAQLRDRASFLPLMRLLRGPYPAVDDILGDATSISLSKIVASLYDDEPDDLFEIIADPSLHESIRDAVWRAATTLVLGGRLDREVMRAFIVRFDAERLAPKGNVAWIGWLDAISHLGFQDIAATIGGVWIDQRLPADVLERRHFDADLAAALAAPMDVSLLSERGFGLVDDVAEALNWVEWDGPPQPVVNPLRDVGRNDPCPCGSGKKAKKCCLKSG